MNFRMLISCLRLSFGMKTRRMLSLKLNLKASLKLSLILCLGLGLSIIAICIPEHGFAQQGSKPKIAVSETDAPLAFPIVSAKASAIYIDEKDAGVVHIAATAFKNDIQLLTQQAPPIYQNNAPLSTYPILIGTLGHSFYIDQLAKSGKINKADLAGKWEGFSISVVQNPFKGVKAALVIAGSDRRGTAFGVFELSRMLGVSPLCWWADVRPVPKKAIYITAGKSIAESPSVKYRGIFINDEDWGLQPWAAQQMDTDVKDIGPKAYTKIFELLLRLKANYIWPGMHPSTKAFYHYTDNPKIADAYAIVLGSSHCEPMLRNNVFEWSANFQNEYGIKPGEWRYDLNKDQIAQYWTDRVKQAKGYESIYTVGMRGIHDGSMPGPDNKNEKVQLLGRVITDQRAILAKNLVRPISSVPQIFCPYKEVLSLYQSGLTLPDDVTIVWADDNHGYIRQLSNAEEQRRTGGSGVYYHLSYWGVPNDYLWLSTISPSLISYELTKAYQYHADRVWIINVGDIKPAEMETQFAMDLAWNVQQWSPDKASSYAQHWAAETFGEDFAAPIAEIKKEYYRLAQAAKPEHLGVVNFTEAEADQRLADYQKITQEAQDLSLKIPERLRDAYFELILYPVESAGLMNAKIVYAKKSIALAGVDTSSAFAYAEKAKAAFEQIKRNTKKYNEEIAGGKWKGIMSWNPRNQSVFDMPKVATRLQDTAKTSAKITNKATALTVIDSSGNQVINIRAAAYTKKFVPGGYLLQTLGGLGLGGDGISVYPFTFSPVAENELAKAAYAEYTVDVKEKGEYQIVVKCLPTQGVNRGSKVRYAIAVNGDQAQVINISPASENSIWRKNVLQGYASGITKHQVALPGQYMIRVYLLDPGMVINQLEIQKTWAENSSL